MATGSLDWSAREEQAVNRPERTSRFSSSQEKAASPLNTTWRPLGSAERPPRSDLSSLSEGERVFDVHAEVAHRIFDLGVTKQDLNHAQIARCPVDY